MNYNLFFAYSKSVLLRKETMRAVSSCLILLVLLPLAAMANEIKIVTEEFPPYDFRGKDGRVEGFATEVIKEVLSDLEVSAQVDILPWARAFKMASENPNTMLFSVVRTEERERLFYWVGVVCEVRSFLYKLKSRKDIVAEKLSDLENYRIGVVRGWAGQKYLLKNNFSLLEEVADSDQNILKLISGRVDLIEDYEANTIFRIKKLGFDPNLVEKVYFNKEISGPLYAVFNTETPVDTVDRFKRAFALVHKDGRYAAIRAKWRQVN